MEVSIRPLVPHGAPPGTMRVWVAVFGFADLPDLSWTVDDRPVVAQPDPRLPLRLAYPANDRLRVATGVFDLPTVGPDRRAHAVRVVATSPHAASASCQLDMRTVPAEVPTDGSSFNVLLVSCFYRGGDKAGRAGGVASQLTGVDRPDVVLTVGDQVYLDQPPLNASFDDKQLAATFAQKYRDNFVGDTGYAQILHAAPVAGIPDDHEYWNNYPHRSAMTLQSLFKRDEDLQDNPWHKAARAMYDAFQLSRGGAYSYRFDVPPLSFFMMDNRTFRTPDGQHTMRSDDLELYRAWVDDVGRRRLVPIVVTGPSLFQPAKHGLKRLLDRNFANYDDYPDVMDGLTGLARQGRRVLALTGDVHYGRTIDATLFGTDAATGTSVGSIREIISSPASLVWGSKHQRPGVAPTRFAPGAPAVKLDTTPVWPGKPDIRGDHVTLLKFTRAAGGVSLEIQYRMIREVAGQSLGSYRLPSILIPG